MCEWVKERFRYIGIAITVAIDGVITSILFSISFFSSTYISKLFIENHVDGGVIDSTDKVIVYAAHNSILALDMIVVVVLNVYMAYSMILRFHKKHFK